MAILLLQILLSTLPGCISGGLELRDRDLSVLDARLKLDAWLLLDWGAASGRSGKGEPNWRHLWAQLCRGVLRIRLGRSGEGGRSGGSRSCVVGRGLGLGVPGEGGDIKLRELALPALEKDG